MSTITKTVEVAKCDWCGKDESVYCKCPACGKDGCFNCGKTHMVEYYEGTDRGNQSHYCIECDSELRQSNADLLHSAFRRVALLRQESKEYYADWNVRADNATKILQDLLRATR